MVPSSSGSSVRLPRPFARGLVSAAAIAVGLAASTAQADQYEFIKVLDSSGPYSNQFNAPDINSGGDITFYAQTDAGALEILRYHEGQLTVVATTLGAANYLLGRPAINDSGWVAWYERLPPPNVVDRVRRWNGQVTEVVATAGGASNLTAIYDDVELAASGAVIVRADEQFDPGIRLVDIGQTATLASLAQNGIPGYSYLSGNASGSAVFHGLLANGTSGIFRSAGSLVTPIASTGTSFLSFVPGSSINNLGEVSFLAYVPGGLGDGGLYLTQQGVPVLLVDHTSPLSFGVANNQLLATSVNDSGTVAFSAFVEAANGKGICTVRVGEPYEIVIKKGDPLFGSTVNTISFESRGLNNHGDIAFRYKLNNLVEGVAIAKNLSTVTLGDLDGDGDVDATDLAALLGAWGTNDAGADLDGDGTVGAADLAVLLGNWGA